MKTEEFLKGLRDQYLAQKEANLHEAADITKIRLQTAQEVLLYVREDLQALHRIAMIK
jgi:hypothetical protein